MDSLNSVSAIYTRGDNKVDISVSRILDEYTEEGPGISLLNVENADWATDANRLIILGVVVLPQRDDTITVIVNGNRLVYEVMGRDIDPPYRYTTSTRKRLIIRTNLVTETAV